MATETGVDLDLDPYCIDQLDFDPPCDFGVPIPQKLYNAHLGPHDDPARWVLFKQHPCGRTFMLVCERCKVTLYDTPGYIACTWCESMVDNREFYSRCEPLSRS